MVSTKTSIFQIMLRFVQQYRTDQDPLEPSMPAIGQLLDRFDGMSRVGIG